MRSSKYQGEREKEKETQSDVKIYCIIYAATASICHQLASPQSHGLMGQKSKRKPKLSIIKPAGITAQNHSHSELYARIGEYIGILMSTRYLYVFFSNVVVQSWKLNILSCFFVIFINFCHHSVRMYVSIDVAQRRLIYSGLSIGTKKLIIWMLLCQQKSK